MIMDESYLGRSELPRGIRNNNPGNIERNYANNWKGKVPSHQNTDERFEQFIAFVYGVRAMIRLIRDTYIKRRALNTIELIVHKYAPMSENNTTAYINAVCKASGIKRGAKLSTDYTVIKSIVQAMATHENGSSDAVTDEMFAAAWSIA